MRIYYFVQSIYYYILKIYDKKLYFILKEQSMMENFSVLKSTIVLDLNIKNEIRKKYYFSPLIILISVR